MPEMKTSRVGVSIDIACAKCPFGTASSGDVIVVKVVMVSSLRLVAG